MQRSQTASTARPDLMTMHGVVAHGLALWPAVCIATLPLWLLVGSCDASLCQSTGVHSGKGLLGVVTTPSSGCFPLLHILSFGGLTWIMMDSTGLV
jgi:hypothetical protein